LTELKKYIEHLTPLSATSWDQLKNLFVEKELKKDEYFITAGQIAKEIAFLESGILRAFYRNGEGTEYNKHFFVSPCFIGGYASLITGTPNQINQQALSACKILVADYAALKALYPSCQDIETLSRTLAERFFVHKEQREIEIVLLDADKRYQLFQQQFPTLEQQIPQYHIASYLGITPTQLSRIRRKLAKT
jgi:CRP-like cAMP-binding protein